MAPGEKTEPKAPAGLGRLEDHRIPTLRIAAFCDSPEMTDTVAGAAADRRMMRTTVETATGGTGVAIDKYRTASSPDLIILERQVPGDVLIEELEQLADACDVGTKVLVIGTSNDVSLYRDLLSRGISDYLVGPVTAPELIAAIGRIYESGDAKKVGRTYAFIGTKGGVGSSTVAHNVASSLDRRFDQNVILADLDLPFGTAALDFNLPGAHGIGDVLENPGRLDEGLFAGLLENSSDRLSILAAPLTLERNYDLDEAAFDEMLEIAKISTSHVVLDLPHLWTRWMRRMLVAADEVVLTTGPDLANLRNAKALVKALRMARPNDPPPKIILNQVGASKRPEIKPRDFAKALEMEPVANIAFDPRLFGTAANEGKMIAGTSAKPAASFAKLAETLLESGGLRSKRAKRAGFLGFFSPSRRRSA